MEIRAPIPERQNFPDGFFALKPGRIVRVKECPNGYPLPFGLEPGERVRIVNFDHGDHSVEKNCRCFDVFLTNVF